MACLTLKMSLVGGQNGESFCKDEFKGEKLSCESTPELLPCLVRPVTFFSYFNCDHWCCAICCDDPTQLLAPDRLTDGVFPDTG